MKSKWLAPILPYFAVWVGLFIFKNAWVTLLGFHLAIAVALILLRPALPLNTFFKRAKRRHIFLSLFFGIASGLCLYLLRDVFAVSANLRAQLAEIGLNDSTWFGFIAYFAFVNPFFEEYFWRGILGSDTKQFYIGDLIYAGYHILVVWNKTHPLSMVLMICVLTLAGWFWRQCYRRDGSLLAPLLGHLAGDLSILLAAYFMAR
jgi:membrane protease YdiL (CAAX protease family)